LKGLSEVQIRGDINACSRVPPADCILRSGFRHLSDVPKGDALVAQAHCGPSIDSTQPLGVLTALEATDRASGLRTQSGPSDTRTFYVRHRRPDNSLKRGERERSRVSQGDGRKAAYAASWVGAAMGAPSGASRQLLSFLKQMACLTSLCRGFWHAIFVKRVSADQLQPFVTRPAGRLTLHSHLGNSGSETLVELGC
jgi:hypothetical protein